MVSSASLKLILVAIFLGLLVCLPTGSEGRTCVSGCMSDVFSCKRKAALGEGDTEACCEQYYKCFLDCKPGATRLPSCGAKVGKRGSWNKREFDREGQLSLGDFF